MAPERPPSAGSNAAPLAGVTVLDLTSVIFGPYCTQILADLGATVIKVEGPEGDTTRQIGPGREAGMRSPYLNLNRGKKGVMLDLKRPEAVAAVLRLCDTADLFIHSMRPQAIERLGLTYRAVAARNPAVVYCNAWGFGRGGPYHHKAAYDDIIEAASGMVALIEQSTGRASYPPSALADKVAGLTLAYSCLAALLHAGRSGAGQEIEVPMFETMVSFTMLEHLGGAMFEPPLGPPVYSRLVSPTRLPLQTSDGRISVIIYTNGQWQSFGRIIGRPDVLADPRFKDMAARLAHVDAVYGFLAEQFLTRTTAQWQALLDAAGIPAMPVNSIQDLYADPHLAAVGFFQDLEDADMGVLRYPRQPARFSGTMPDVRRRAPRLGEHTAEVLRGAGLSDAEIAALLAGAEGTPEPAMSAAGTGS
ncbi:MAG: CoA transferase [Alphaproteobacteria bacterium]|nr:CoA transferase [Alphaproteobacteria bacterium]